MIMIGHFQLKKCNCMLFCPPLFCLWVGLCLGQTCAAPELQQCSSSSGARGIWLLAALLTFALHLPCNISLHLVPSRAQQDKKIMAGDKVAFCLWQGTEPHDLSPWTAVAWHALRCRERSKCCKPPWPPYKQPPPPDALSLTAEQNEGYFWFIAATCNELYLGGLLIWRTLARVYCLPATDGKTNSIDDGNPFIVLWIQHPPESTTKPLSVSLNTTFYI